MNENDPHELSSELEGEAKELEQKLETLDHEISEVREDWLRKQEDDDVPGAVVPSDESATEHG